MKVGITGISSTLAICLVGMLVADSNVEKIIGLDVKLYDGPGDEKIVFRKGDVRNADAVRELLRGVDVLFHMAFVVKHGVPDLRDEILDINVNGSKNVFLQAAASGIKKIIYVSSVAAYGINPGTPLVIKEDTPCKGKEMPQFYYAHTKGLVEEFLDAFEAEHRDIIVTRFRPHIIAGPCFAGRTTNLDIILKPLASAKKRIFLTKPVNAPALMLQYTHEKDLVAAMIHAMHHDMPGAYNIA
nr:NAD-dependent epimerase/dehydratase family protein [Candidatus Sigynarchaeota archaeon]